MNKIHISMKLKKEELYNIAMGLLRDNKHLYFKYEDLKIDMLSSIRTIRYISNTFEPRPDLFDDAVEDCDMIKPIKSKGKQPEGYQ